MPFPSDPADGIKEVKTTLLRLADFSHQFGRLTIESDDAGHRDIHTASARWFGAADPLKQPYWRVTQARLRITFHPEASDKREKTISICAHPMAQTSGTRRAGTNWSRRSTWSPGG